MSKFDFVGFEPTQTLQKMAKLKFGRIHMDAPSDATTKATIHKTSDGFEGFAQIRSIVGEFVAKVVAEDPQKSLVLLTRKIRSQLRIWKRSRFILPDSSDDSSPAAQS